MSHWQPRGEKSVDICVRVEHPDEPGVWSHFCIARSELVGLRIEGVPALADVFCPLCGLIARAIFENKSTLRAMRVESYAGPKCPHGFPDKPCTELAAQHDDVHYALITKNGIPELAAAELGYRYDCAPTLVQWAKPCPLCWEESARPILPMLLDELRVVGRRLAADLRSAQKSFEDLRVESARLNRAMILFDDLRRRLNEVPGPQRIGFVYLIGHESAVKIGWSEQHPKRRRLSPLQTASSTRLEVLGVMVGPASLERELQNKFMAHRIRGEWFARSEEILLYFGENGIAV